jgi:predicted ATPase with chaperone activity
MPATGTHSDLGRISALLAGAGFQPAEPRSLEETGLAEGIVESLVCKQLAASSCASGRRLAGQLCLPFAVLEPVLRRMRNRQRLTHRSGSELNDFDYVLTEQGRVYAQQMLEDCSYVGPAPVPLADYVASVDAQTITAGVVRRDQLEQAFRDISVKPELVARLGPAVNSGTGLFLYGAPGNGKTTLADRITLCFGQEVWIPRVLLADGEIVKLYDPAYHHAAAAPPDRVLKHDNHDRRWIKVRRPTVVAGGELTMDSLEIRHSPHSHVSEAPLQLKSNCGSLLIDDFGRQRLDPRELLNRWIVPLEKRFDFLTLASGKKIQVPFDQLIIFSTNLDPRELVDEAFLRRIPYKIHVPDPDEEEFHRLFELNAPQLGCVCDSAAVEYLLATHYRPLRRPLRRCHARDLLLQIRHHCAYQGLPFQMLPEYLDQAAANYFTVVG